MHPDDLAALGVGDGAMVDLVGEDGAGGERRAPGFRTVGYPVARGCAAAYFPETNVLVPLDSTATTSNTPTSKSIVIRLEPATARCPDGPDHDAAARSSGSTAAASTTRPDTLVVEEPLEIRVNGRPLAVTMRTPGDDIDLVHGFLLTEGIIERVEDVSTARYCAGDVGEGNTYNVIDVALAAGVAAPDVSLERSFYTTSSCGVCGKASIDAIRVRARHDVAATSLMISPAVLARAAGQAPRRPAGVRPHRRAARRRVCSPPTAT